MATKPTPWINSSVKGNFLFREGKAAIENGMREFTQSWREVIFKLKTRCMNGPKLAIGDGAIGFWSALEEVYPETRQQCCWMHKTMNVLNGLPKFIQAKAKDSLHDIWQAETKADARKAFDLFIEMYEPKYPKAAAFLQKDRVKRWLSITSRRSTGRAFGLAIPLSQSSKPSVNIPVFRKDASRMTACCT